MWGCVLNLRRPSSSHHHHWPPWWPSSVLVAPTGLAYWRCALVLAQLGLALRSLCDKEVGKFLALPFNFSWSSSQWHSLYRKLHVWWLDIKAVIWFHCFGKLRIQLCGFCGILTHGVPQLSSLSDPAPRTWGSRCSLTVDATRYVSMTVDVWMICLQFAVFNRLSILQLTSYLV